MLAERQWLGARPRARDPGKHLVQPLQKPCDEEAHFTNKAQRGPGDIPKFQSFLDPGPASPLLGCRGAAPSSRRDCCQRPTPPEPASPRPPVSSTATRLPTVFRPGPHITKLLPFPGEALRPSPQMAMGPKGCGMTWTPVEPDGAWLSTGSDTGYSQDPGSLGTLGPWVVREFLMVAAVNYYSFRATITGVLSYRSPGPSPRSVSLG